MSQGSKPPARALPAVPAAEWVRPSRWQAFRLYLRNGDLKGHITRGHKLAVGLVALMPLVLADDVVGILPDDIELVGGFFAVLLILLGIRKYRRPPKPGAAPTSGPAPAA
ncbi:MAG TPA: hypothetical protein VLF67_02120 [Candidatus Saccharimonas sp.]|nr:hypothetical protein [Candidatus Saccharimonas sp.]